MFFDKLQKTDRFIFDKFREKIRYFHPAFHSTTPEGLNGRLTFLLQCVRPGDTIPVKGISDSLDIGARNTSFGPEYKISSIDPETGKKFSTEIMLDELDFRKPSQDPNEDGSFTIKLPKSNATVKVKPLTFKEIGEINKLADQYPTGRVAPKVTWKLQKQIISVEGDSEQGTINRFVEGLPIMDSKFIRNFIDENEPRLDLRRTIIAPSGNKVDVEIAFGVEFFRVFF